MNEVYCLIYSSRISLKALMSFSTLMSLAEDAKEKNAHDGITGFLCFGNNNFLQYVEGSKDAIDRLVNRLKADRRHKDFRILMQKCIPERLFKEWPMFATTYNHFVTNYSQAYQFMPFSPSKWSISQADDFISMLKDYYHNYNHDSHFNFAEPALIGDDQPPVKYALMGMAFSGFLGPFQFSLFVRLMSMLMVLIVGLFVLNLSFAVIS